VRAFIHTATFPIMVKAAEAHLLPKGARSATIVATPEQLISIYREAESTRAPNLLFQEYIPESFAEDWIYHGYRNPQTNCLVGFTGRKLRSHPAFAGATALGLSVANDRLALQTESFLRAIGYAGIMDLDYRLDRRSGQYKLLDFNPRIGANFRMFEDRSGIDVVRALHLDLTGKIVPRSPAVENRAFIVEPDDLLAGFSYRRHGAPGHRQWRLRPSEQRELAWFNRDDPLPFWAMCARLLPWLAWRANAKAWSWLATGAIAGPWRCASAKRGCRTGKRPMPPA
jgi:predicted ATP-grasp superfamily ATP-dependent carboligase